MDKLQKLLFELSGNYRMEIMTLLQGRIMKLSNIAQEIDLKTPETTRHLQRLVDAKLVQKDSSGLYGLTPFGALVLPSLSGTYFLSRHADYFLEHDASCLPYEFLGRMGELSEGVLVDDTFENLENTSRSFRQARKYLWMVTRGRLTPLALQLLDKLDESFDLRAIFQEDSAPKDSDAVIPSTRPGFQKRIISKVGVVLWVSELSASFCLPLRGDKIIYSGFQSADPRFRMWCSDLFLHYWDKAKPYVPE